MTPIDSQRTLAELVLEQPGRARIFEELRLDYCCGGDHSLAATAARDGLDLHTLVLALEAQERAFDGGRTERDWRTAPIAELCDHIVDEHHALLRRELPHIGDLTAKVAARHGTAVPALHELAQLFDELRADLIAHIDREEELLFPACRELGDDADGEAVAALLARLGMHEAEHAEVGRALAEMRELAGDYRPEQALCTTYGVMLESLLALERDLHQHIHEENNVLFARLRARVEEAPAPAA